MAGIGKNWWFFMAGSGVGGGSTTAYALDAEGEYLAWVFRAHTSGPVLTKAAIRPTALTGSSPTYVLSLQGVDLATGLPDGTIKGGASPVSVEITPISGDAGLVKEYTFANSYDSSAGELLALVITPKSGTSIDGSNFWTFSGRSITSAFPYIVHNGSVLAFGSFFGVSDGTTWWGQELFQSSGVFVTIGSSPVYAGNYFTIPAAMGATVQCVGAWAGMYSAGDYRTSLYNSSDNLLASTDHDAQFPRSSAEVLWDDGPVTLTCGSSYRIVQTVVASTGRLYYAAVANAAHWDVSPWQQTVQYTAGSTGSWTDTATMRAALGIIVDDITEPSAGGLLRHPGMFGGMNG